MTATTPIRIMLVDDLEMVRDSLKIFLSNFEDLEVVADASHGEQAMKLCAKLQPDVLLLDMVMPGMTGLTTTQGLREVCPSTKVLILTAYTLEPWVQQTGAVGYVFKDASPEQLVSAIRAAHTNHLSY